MHRFLFVGVFVLLFSLSVKAQETSLQVQVEGIKKAKGEVGVTIFQSPVGYPAHLEHSYDTEWIPLKGQTRVMAVFDTLAPGEWGIAVLHDENGNRALDKNIQATPQEGFGVPCEADFTLRYPKFHDCKISLQGGEKKTVIIPLQYPRGGKVASVPKADAVAHAPEMQMPSSTLRVRVNGIDKRPGEVGVAVFHKDDGYPIELKSAYAAEWLNVNSGQPSADFLFENLFAGEWAVSVLHDENGNRALETTTLGFPKEGVGFSNDQRVKLSAPKFKKSKFTLSAGETKEVVIHLEYRK